jgi:hypothetical protein
MPFCLYFLYFNKKIIKFEIFFRHLCSIPNIVCLFFVDIYGRCVIHDTWCLGVLVCPITTDIIFCFYTPWLLYVVFFFLDIIVLLPSSFLYSKELDPMEVYTFEKSCMLIHMSHVTYTLVFFHYNLNSKQSWYFHYIFLLHMNFMLRNTFFSQDGFLIEIGDKHLRHVHQSIHMVFVLT